MCMYPLELNLQVVVSSPVWVLGTELSSSGRPRGAHSYQAIFPAHKHFKMQVGG